jgi:hypothetical protein
MLMFALLLAMLTSVSLAEDSAANLDMSLMTNAELYALRTDVTQELIRRTQAADTPEPSTDTVILFRGFPWLASETEMLANLKPLGYTSHTRGEGSGYSEIGSWEIRLDENFYEEEPILSNREIGYWVAMYFRDELKVAGFTVSNISMDFLYGHDAARVYRDSANSRMISATYRFSVADPEAAFEILQAKMTALYGAPVLASAEGGSYSVRHAIWYGAEDTAVRLDMRIAKRDSNPAYALQLCYGRSNSLELIAALQSAITNEILAQGSMDGL